MLNSVTRHPLFCPLSILHSAHFVAYLYSAHCAASILPTVQPVFCPLCSLYSAHCVAYLYSAHCASCILPPCTLSSSSIRPFLYSAHSATVYPSATLSNAYCFLVTAFILCSLPPLHPLFRTFLHAVHSPLRTLHPLLSHCASYTLLYTAIETSCDGMRVVKVSCPSLQNICRLIASYRSHPCLYTSDMALCPDSGQRISSVFDNKQQQIF
jgi:hypothetical protein